MGADGRRRYTVPFRIVPERGKVSEDLVETTAFEDGNIFHDDVSRSKLPNKTCVLGPKTRSGSSADPGSTAGNREVLTGESSDEDVDWFNF